MHGPNQKFGSIRISIIRHIKKSLYKSTILNDILCDNFFVLISKSYWQIG